MLLRKASFRIVTEGIYFSFAYNILKVADNLAQRVISSPNLMQAIYVSLTSAIKVSRLLQYKVRSLKLDFLDFTPVLSIKLIQCNLSIVNTIGSQKRRPMLRGVH